ncbi:camp-binding protein 1-related [Anaeramoeba flamelloides]|uniref:Camp-binding protein 1-related n=1 Tax=Anaeramoeba flamelloides TaxID=1746091 RepID=A0AAV7Z7D3_9EUKA|nr:camp-binding protein 1-related [Anaeramoeba flamelloides]
MLDEGPIYISELSAESRLKLVLTVHSAEGIPAMDRGGTSDPFVEFKFSRYSTEIKRKTPVIKKTLSPVWNKEFTISFGAVTAPNEVDFKVYDWDKFSSNDLIGKAKLKFRELLGGIQVPFNQLTKNKNQREFIVNDEIVLPIVGKKKKDHGKLKLKYQIHVPVDKLAISPNHYPKVSYETMKLDPLNGINEVSVPLNTRIGIGLITDYEVKELPFDIEVAAIPFSDVTGKMGFPVYYANKKIDGLTYLSFQKMNFGEVSQNTMILAFDGKVLKKKQNDVIVLVASITSGLPQEMGKYSFTDYPNFNFSILDLSRGITQPKLVTDFPLLTQQQAQTFKQNGVKITTIILGTIRNGLKTSKFTYQPINYPRDGFPIAESFGDIMGQVKQYSSQFLSKTQPFHQGERMILMRKPVCLDFDFMKQVEPTWMEGFTVGLGWDCSGGASIDLDASVIMLSATGEYEIIFYGKKTSSDGAVVHSGDNTTGEGEGDDEQIKINLFQVAQKWVKIVVIITSFRKHTFDVLDNAYIRLLKDNIHCFLRYDLDNLGKKTGLVVSTMHRDQQQGWYFEAVGKVCDGSRPQDCVGKKNTSEHKPLKQDSGTESEISDLLSNDDLTSSEEFTPTSGDQNSDSD